MINPTRIRGKKKIFEMKKPVLGKLRVGFQKRMNE